ncbi:hypothetical protein [Pseudomonas fluorescens]|uniref:hypothetical protein n=1 Tax=Pseudomonas fluorescens TaxID=294 RepID=UPI00190FCC7F|nr:hypothetical protein [Pseudomonas fluorescens]
MKYFKDNNTGERFAYDEFQISSGLVRLGLVEIGEDELKDIFFPPKTQDQINSEARSYLSKTDWYLVRKIETGQAVPDDVLKSRAEARDQVIDY